jgi:CRISPR/Cas system CSM-associated protein Csm2 small subunit
MTIKGKGNRKDSLRGFYGRALDEAEKLELEEACHVEGIDEEIALLRVKLRELLEEQPDRIDLHFEAANVIARLVKTRYQITKEQKKSLKEAIQKVLTEVAVPLGVGVGVKLASR